MPTSTLTVMLLALALALVALSGEAAKRTRLVPSLRTAVLLALAAANAAFLLVRGAQAGMPHLDPFAMAAACILVGWLLLRDFEGTAVPPPADAAGANVVVREPSLLRPLAEAAEALVIGSLAGTLTLLSIALAAAAGIATTDWALYGASVLCGLLVLVTLPQPTFFHVSLAAAAWLGIVRGMAAAAIDAQLPIMLALFMLVSWGAAVFGGMPKRGSGDT